MKEKGRGYLTNTIQGAVEFLSGLQGHFHRRLSDDNNKQSGIETTSWYKISDLVSLDISPINDENFKVIETGQYFFTSDRFPVV